MIQNSRCYGSAPSRIAVVHGGPGALGSVAAIARELSAEHGVMEPLQTAMTLDGQVEELHEVLESLGTPPITLIGHSWGAWLSLIVAARYPSLVRKLILVSSGPFEAKYVPQLQETRLSRLSPAEQSDFQRLLSQLGAAEGDNKSRLMTRLGDLVAKSDNFDAISIPTEEADTVVVDGDQYHAVWSEAAALRQSGALLSMARAVACPVVTIHGDSDPHPAAGVQEPLQEACREFRFYLLERCGHSPWKERHARDEFYRILRQEL